MNIEIFYYRYPLQERYLRIEKVKNYLNTIGDRIVILGKGLNL